MAVAARLTLYPNEMNVEIVLGPLHEDSTTHEGYHNKTSQATWWSMKMFIIIDPRLPGQPPPRLQQCCVFNWRAHPSHQVVGGNLGTHLQTILEKHLDIPKNTHIPPCECKAQQRWLQSWLLVLKVSPPARIPQQQVQVDEWSTSISHKKLQLVITQGNAAK